MIERQKTNIEQAGVLLKKLKHNSSDLETLLELQRFLVRRITAAERAIVRSKAAARKLRSSLNRGRYSKGRSAAIKAIIRSAQERVGQNQHLIFIWKCFGDGIAHLYFDKYALKHTFYNMEDYSAKEDSGFLTNKEGFRMEWRVVRLAISRGAPIVLCDITNVLRHGDVCIARGNDPFPIELKSSKNRNSRVDRQLQNLRKLHEFFAKDEADIRGHQNVKRIEFKDTEINHTAALNACIQRSYAEGTTIISPEPGLYYVSTSDEFDEAKMNSIPIQSCAMFAINGTKTEGVWMPYFPFTLSLDLDHLYKFINGEVYLVVCVDLAVIQDRFRSHGVHAKIINDGTWFIGLKSCENDSDELISFISEHLFLRIPLEFQSLAWFVDVQARLEKEVIEPYRRLDEQ